MSAAEFNEEVKKIAPMVTMIPAERIEAMKTRIVDNLVAQKIIDLVVAPKLKSVSEADLAKEFKRFTDQVGNNPGGVEAFYKRAGLTEANVKEDMKKGLAFKIVLAKDHDIKAAPKDIKKFYRKNKARFDKKAEVKASHILFKAKPDNEAELIEAKKKATAVYKLAKKPGADFAALAKEYSEGPSGPKGGDLGFFTKERMVPSFSKAAFKTRKGGVSKPVKTNFGYHVIKVFDKKKAGLTPLSEVSETIKEEIELRKVKEVMKGYFVKQRKIRKVEVLMENIKDNPEFKSKPTQMPLKGAENHSPGPQP